MATVEDGSHVAQSLLEHGEALASVRERQAENLVLPVHPTRPDAEPEAAPRQVVDGQSRLGEHGRVAKRDGAHQHGKTDRGCVTSEGGQLGECVERRNLLAGRAVIR